VFVDDFEPTLHSSYTILLQMPKREAVLRISEGVRNLNQDAPAQQQRDVADLRHGLRQRIWWTSGVVAVYRHRPPQPSDDYAIE
jgi:hypothetical protein